MKIRDAILAAADNLGKKPEAYEFQLSHIATCENDPACLLGKIGYFRGVSAGRVIDSAHEIIGVSWEEFFSRMQALADPLLAFTLHAKSAALGLRRYADKYHPAEKRDLIPAGVREIFSREYTARDLVP